MKHLFKIRFSIKSSLLLIFALLILSSGNTFAQIGKKTDKKTNSQELSKKPNKETRKGVRESGKTTNIDSKNKEVPKEIKPVKEEKIASREEKATTVEKEEPKYQEIIEEKPNGVINWSVQYVEAKGMSVIDTERFNNHAQAKLMARRGAIVDAQRNLLEIVQGVRVVSETKVSDMITESDYVLTQIDGVIKNAELVGDAVEVDGIMEVTMRVPMYSRNGLASAIYSEVEGQSRKAMGGKSEINFAGDNNSEIDISSISDLVFNFNGKEYSPSMFPIILDENDNILLDFSKYYDPKSGKFPKIVSGAKEIIDAVGSKKGAQIIDVIESFDGKIKIDNSKISKKINWQKIGKVATTIGKVVVSLIL